MTFRGWFALNGVEIANSSRVTAHLGVATPTSDVGMFSSAEDCSLPLLEPGRLVAAVAPSQAAIAPGRLLYTPADGTRLYGPGLGLVGECWTSDNMCFGCRVEVGYDDTWPGLQAFLSDLIYRPELAPWYTVRAPESGEFGGVWVMDVKGLGPTPVSRSVIEMAGDGGAAGPHRNPTRTVTFEALLIACTSAGLEYGLQWLNCQLLDTVDRDDSVLRYLAAHPGHSSADPASLVREVHGVVLTKEVHVTEQVAGGGREHEQATMYRVSWEFTVLRPHAYLPAVDLDVEWTDVTTQPIRWVHAPACKEPEDCDDMPVLYAASCEVERIEVIATPPPTCGGCLPVGLLDTHRFEVPVFNTPYRCHQTAVSLVITNTGVRDLTLQGSYRLCAALEGCDIDQFPFQVNELPAGAQLHLDGISGRYWVHYNARKRRPVGIVGTPSGVPWRPAMIDRSRCWELVVLADGGADFTVSMSLADREA